MSDIRKKEPIGINMIDIENRGWTLGLFQLWRAVFRRALQFGLIVAPSIALIGIRFY